MLQATTTMIMIPDQAAFVTTAITPLIPRRITTHTTISPTTRLRTMRAHITHTVRSRITIGKMKMLGDL